MPTPAVRYTKRTDDGTTDLTELHGYSAHETAGAAAVIAITDGSGGTEVIQINLGAAGSSTEMLPGIQATSGNAWHVDVQSGTVEITCFGR